MVVGEVHAQKLPWLPVALNRGGQSNERLFRCKPQLAPKEFSTVTSRDHRCKPEQYNRVVYSFSVWNPILNTRGVVVS